MCDESTFASAGRAQRLTRRQFGAASVGGADNGVFWAIARPSKLTV